MDNLKILRRILGDTLNLGPRAEELTAGSQLLGGIPELDSLSVVTLLTAIEAEYGIQIGHEELSADLFTTLGTLNEFVLEKVDSLVAH